MKGYRCWGQNAFDDNIPYFDYQWWLHTVPIAVSLGINCLILLNITRVVWSKMMPNARHSGTAHDAILKTFKATCLLIPMLGLSQVLLSKLR